MSKPADAPPPANAPASSSPSPVAAAPVKSRPLEASAAPPVKPAGVKLVKRIISRPPSAPLVKASPSLPAGPPSPPPVGSTSLSSAVKAPTTAAGPSSSSASSTNAPPPGPPQVPKQSWYANPFSASTNTPMTEFHQSMRGKMLFSDRPVPVSATELLALPNTRPSALTTFEVGKDLIYGMAYLYDTPLAIEHRWRGRVAHLLRVRKKQETIPAVVWRQVEALASVQKLTVAEKDRAKEGKLETCTTGTAPSQHPSKAPFPLDYERAMRFERDEDTVYDRPENDLLVGFKVFVKEELVEDHYPSPKSLPQCTATLTAKEAAQHWNCVPFVLMGFLNRTMLDPMCLFHALSLSFVEHLLRVRIESFSPSPESIAGVLEKKPKLKHCDLPLRVEVVYGCRAEAYYCTDFISRGSCTLRVTEKSKAALKSYEEKLRLLVRTRRGAPQLIPRENMSLRPIQNCSGCGHPLKYLCTVCGAEVCGLPTCVANLVLGYPRACSRHFLTAP